MMKHRTEGLSEERARLIAAAPEMLEALKMVRDKASSSIGIAVIQGPEMQVIWDAIAKALYDTEGA